MRVDEWARPTRINYTATMTLLFPILFAANVPIQKILLFHSVGAQGIVSEACATKTVSMHLIYIGYWAHTANVWCITGQRASVVSRPVALKLKLKFSKLDGVCVLALCRSAISRRCRCMHWACIEPALSFLHFLFIYFRLTFPDSTFRSFI